MQTVSLNLQEWGAYGTPFLIFNHPQLLINPTSIAEADFLD